MPLVVTWDTISLSQPEPFEIKPMRICNYTILADGRCAVQESSITGMQITFNCTTEDFTEPLKIFGTMGAHPLSITSEKYGMVYKNMYVYEFSNLKEILPNAWQYSVTFIQDTTLP